MGLRRVRRRWSGVVLASSLVLALAPAGSARAQPGTVLADSGFRPGANGFAFENYGAAPNSELIPEDMRTIFGNGVCVDASDAVCKLTPPAQTWMDKENKGAAGGHCSGFSVTSLLFFKNSIAPSSFGAATVPALPLPDNVLLQRRIAHSAIFQTFTSVNNARFEGTPNEVLDKLIAVLQPTEAETFTIGITKLDNSGGHAVTPYSVVERADNKFGVLIYENNEPGVVKEIIFDRTANTWTYDARTNPSQPSDTYTGTAASKSMFLLPTTPGIGVQPCPFCNPAPPAAQRPAALAAGYVEVDLLGNNRNHARLLITDTLGGRIGFSNGQLVRQMPGARADIPLRAAPQTSQFRLEPSYTLPADRAYQLAINGSEISGVDPTAISIVGPGFDVEMSADLRRGEQSQLGITADGRQVSYRPSNIVTPTLELGRDESGADHAFSVRATPVWPGTDLTLRMDPDRFTIKTTGRGQYTSYDIAFERIDDDTDIFFTHNRLVLPPNVTAHLFYRTFTGDHMAVALQIIHPNGQVENRQLADQS